MGERLVVARERVACLPTLRVIDDRAALMPLALTGNARTSVR